MSFMDVLSANVVPTHKTKPPGRSISLLQPDGPLNF